MKKISFILVICVLFCAAIPAKAAKVPVIKGGKSTNLSGKIVKVRYGKDIIKECSKNNTPAIKIGSTVYVPCRTVFSNHGPKAAYQEKGNKVILKYGTRKVTFVKNQSMALTHGTKMKMGCKPFFVTYKKSKVKEFLVPAKQTAIYLGLHYSYSNGMATFSVNKGAGSSATKVTQIQKARFIKKLGPIAKADYQRTGVLASVTLAQAILESGWGQSYLAENANNLFGMKKGLSGNNWDGGAWDGINFCSKGSQYRKYSCAEDSIRDHSAYLVNAKNGSHKRYAGLTSTKSYKSQIRIIQKGGYCTSGSYMSQLCGIIRSYNLTKYDKK